MNPRSFYSTATSPSTPNRQPPPLSQAPLTKPPIGLRYHSRNTSDPQAYHRQPPPSTHLPPLLRRYTEEDTEDAEDDDEEDTEMTAYPSRSAAPNAAASNGSGSRPGSSSKDSGSANKKPKTKSTKVFQCTGYGDCTMQFTRSEHLARHIRLKPFRDVLLILQKTHRRTTFSL